MKASDPNRFTPVVEYVYDHLHETIDVAGLASIAGISRYHFHRCFMQEFGISVSKMIRLLRLRQAAWQLAFRPNLRILDIAVQAGYESGEAFARAFKRCCMQSPREFRRKPDWSYWQNHFAQIHKVALNKEPLVVPHSSLCTFIQTPIALLIHKGPPAEIPVSLAKFIRWRKENAMPPAKSRTFNLFYGSDRNGNYSFGIGCTGVSSVAENDCGVVSSIIPALSCVTADFCGDDSSLAAQISQSIADTPYSLHPDFPPFLERFHFFPDVPAHEASGRIFLPVVA